MAIQRSGILGTAESYRHPDPARLRVFGLPTGVQIGEALPAAAARVLEYAEVCGHSYAVTESAVLQLTTNPAGGPIGVWRAINLVEAGLPAQGIRFQPPQVDLDEYYYDVYRPEPVEYLAESGNRLLVFTAGGAAISLTDPTCTR